MASIEEGKSDIVQCDLCSLPFKRTLSFEYLIKDIEKIGADESNMLSSVAKILLAKLNQIPELKTSIEDKELLTIHQDLLMQMLSFVFNPLNCHVETAAAYAPFDPEPIFSSQLFKETIGAENKKIEIATHGRDKDKLIVMIYQAYFVILEKVYGFKMPIEIPFVFKMTDTQNQSIKYYNIKMDISYLHVNTLGEIKKLKEEEINSLFDRNNDLNYWNELIPLEKFEIKGFMRFKYHDITREYVISELKSDLLDKNTIISKSGYSRIVEKIRALMGNPLVRVGLVSIDSDEAHTNKGYLWNTIIHRDLLKPEDYKGSMYEKAYDEKQIILNRELKEVEQNKVTQAFLNDGISSHAVVPLVIEDKVVGMLEFGCAIPGSLTMLQIKSLYELFPIFALAIKRSQEEWEDKLRAIMQEEFTAIHPTVEWRFKDAAASIIKGNNNDEPFSMDPIIFSNVVPIYGASDIRGSSIERNIAIQSDLMEQLDKAYQILQKEKDIREIPLLSDISYKIGKHLRTVKIGLKAGDEVSIVEFLKKEIDPFLMLLSDREESIKEPIKEYFDMLDPELGVLYKKRKNFEESLTLINDKVSEIIDKEQVKAQHVFPHYFEKYRTDGIEYNGYLGQSLVNDLKYNDMYLKNIRLWQLLVKVKIARKVRDIQSELTTKLDITQLILVHSNPLSIAFRQDEKKFDVAGAYNIRYEITKKRIDKAMIKGTNERLTQVGKIAIIYSHADEITEYKRYIEYMTAQGLLTGKAEELELEDLKGASGLRALRVEVDFKSMKSCQINQEILDSVVEE